MMRPYKKLTRSKKIEKATHAHTPSLTSVLRALVKKPTWLYIKGEEKNLPCKVGEEAGCKPKIYYRMLHYT